VEWRKFQCHLGTGPCCQFAFKGGPCWGLYANADDTTLASMVWYTYGYGRSPFRASAIPGCAIGSLRQQRQFLNANVRLLARISTMPDFRHRGYAKTLLQYTMPKLDVPFIECLTVWPDVRKLLDSVGFECFNQATDQRPDYWLWCR